MGAGAPCFGSFVRRATEADLSPHPLLDTQSPVARTQSTPASPHARAERFDSVYDVYAELYADDDDEGAEGAEGYGEDDQLGELQRGRGVHDYEPEPELPSEDYDEPTEPWDERGKTGLYGGGGRGADDRETGWVSDFTFSLISPGAGHEEDLRFGGDDDGGPRSRQLSRATQGSRAVGGTEQPRRESIETAPSSKGPVTPPDVGSAASLQSSSRENVHPRSMSPALPPPIHTVDAARIKKSKQSPRIPTPSAPIPAGRGVGPLDRSAARPRPKASGGFKWPVRSKKAPIISAPILPEGFVESLGMETFALHPGVKLPQRASMSATGQSRSSSLSPRDIASPNPQQQRAAPTRKAAPLVAQPPTRTEDRPQLVERNGTLSRTTSTSRPTSRLGPVLEESASAPTSRAQTPQRPQHERTASSTTVGSGFRDPWSTAGANRASMHSQQTRTAGLVARTRAGASAPRSRAPSRSWTPRHPSSSNGGGALRYSPVEASPISPAPHVARRARHPPRLALVALLGSLGRAAQPARRGPPLCVVRRVPPGLYAVRAVQHDSAPARGRCGHVRVDDPGRRRERLRACAPAQLSTAHVDRVPVGWRWGRVETQHARRRRRLGRRGRGRTARHLVAGGEQGDVAVRGSGSVTIRSTCTDDRDDGVQEPLWLRWVGVSRSETEGRWTT